MGAGPVEVFFSFVSEDREFYQQIKQQLSPQWRAGRLYCWSHLDVQASKQRDVEIAQHLKSAPIIALLISPAYLGSDYHYDVELETAIRRHHASEARVVPIIVRPGKYEGTPFAMLQWLPSNGKALSERRKPEREQVLSEIVNGLDMLVQQLSLEEAPASPASFSNHNQVWSVPYPRNPYFTGREAELRAIHDALSSGQNAAIVQAISGLGGVGKTQLALEYAHRHREDYRYIFWVLADTRDTLNAEYSKIAELLDLPGKSQPEQRYIVAAVKNWLEKNSDWLLILDNADDLEVLIGKPGSQEPLDSFLPTDAPGRILLTTRANATGGLADSIPIKKLAEDEGTHFLLHRSRVLKKQAMQEQVDHKEHEAAREIVHELDGLPLALDQAGAYIEETSCGLQGYLRLYRKERKELLKARGGLTNNHPDPVATTWKLAFEKVEKADPAAADLLRLCAFLAPDDIPEIIITEGESELTGPLKKLARNSLKFNKAIAELQKYSLISRDPNAQTLSVHRLVQAVIRDAMMKNAERAWAVRVVRTMNRVFPWSKEIATWETCKQLLPHAQACVELIEQWQVEMVEGAHLLHDTGQYLQDRAEYSDASSYFEKAVEIKRKILGNEHSNTAASLIGLANTYYKQGNYGLALALYQQALTICRKTLGDEHHDTAASLVGLALVYQDQGDYEQALALHQQALAIQRKILGEADPDTAGSLSNLALIYEKQGKYDDAERWYKQSLAMRRKMLGETHPSTAASRYNLSHVYKEQRKYVEAEALCKQALEIMRKVLGEAHPDTAYSLNNLGELYQAQGKDEEAETLFQEALAIRLKGLGEAHPDTAESMHNLATLYKSQGKYAEALPLFEKALAVRRDKLVPEHDDIKKTQEAYEETLRKLKEERDG